MTKKSLLTDIPEGLRESAKQRTDDVVSKLKSAMKLMEHEIAQNDGIYPKNYGRINQAEVCRRAGVAKVTLQGSAHKSTSKALVDDWVSARKFKRKPEVRRAVSERADEWKAEHSKIGTQYAIAMLELNEAENKVRELQEEINTLKKQLASVQSLSVIGARSKNSIDLSVDSD